MSAAPTPAEPISAQQAAQELVDLGLSFARMLHKEAEALAKAPEASPKPDLLALAAAFDTISRAVRRTLLLARELAKPLPPARAAASQPPDRTEARKRIIRDVEDLIYREHRETPRDIDTLEAELLDRLDRPDLEQDLAHRPIELIIADLARDLGVGHSLDEPTRVWKPRTKADIATLEARAAAPLPTEPGPPRTTAEITLPWRRRIKLPNDDAKAVEIVLAVGKIRDG